MVTPMQSLSSFASHLGSVRSADGGETQLISSVSSRLALNLHGPESTCKFPSLWLGPLQSRQSIQSRKDLLYSSTWMSESIKVDKANASTIPETLLRNVTTSFGTVVDETRARYLEDAIDQLPCYYKSKGLNNNTLRAQAIRVLATSHPISFTLSMTKVVPASLSSGTLKVSHGDVRVVELPISFMVKVNLLILGYRRTVVVMETPGVIRGSYTLWDPDKLDEISLEFDTGALYLAMRRQSLSLLKTAHRASMVMVSKRRNSGLISKTEQESTKVSATMKPKLSTTTKPEQWNARIKEPEKPNSPARSIVLPASEADKLVVIANRAA